LEKSEKKMNLKIVADSTFSLSEDYVATHGITVVPLNVIIDGVAYLDGIDITLKEVMNAVYADSKVSSSQPSPEVYRQAFLKLQAEGATDILCLTISSTLSGSFGSASLAARELTGLRIHLFDTLSTSVGAEMLAHIIVGELDKGRTIEEALAVGTKYRENSTILMNMENLTALKKSGRLSKIKATIGNLLRVKPIIEYIKGKNNIMSKFRTEKAVVEEIIRRIKLDLTKVKSNFMIYISHVQAEEKILRIKGIIENAIQGITIKVSKEVSPVVAVNLGYGGFGIGWCYD
jgi:DegV family protein with EDD domain